METHRDTPLITLNTHPAVQCRQWGLLPFNGSTAEETQPHVSSLVETNIRLVFMETFAAQRHGEMLYLILPLRSIIQETYEIRETAIKLTNFVVNEQSCVCVEPILRHYQSYTVHHC